ncbi:UNVERIFIED_CONTAM: hypothetical protein Slati_0826100 [Sesamum latifolium]|uniref:DUF8040 domain-containing protein n=1 Tax=Sesamum latifolium TaxID=2727402 RepID=A0AAW2XLS9_9LAMI
MAYRIYRNYIHKKHKRQLTKALQYSLKSRIPNQVENLRCLTGISSGDSCLNNLRMSIDAFCRLCYLLEQLGGLKDMRNVPIREQVAIFFSILAHHTKNRVVKYNFKHTGRTIIKWRWFKQDCLGALDGTYIHVKVAEVDKGRYRNRKGDISVNVLVKGSAADSRVLRDAINRPNGLKVPTGML